MLCWMKHKLESRLPGALSWDICFLLSCYIGTPGSCAFGPRLWNQNLSSQGYGFRLNYATTVFLIFPACRRQTRELLSIHNYLMGPLMWCWIAVPRVNISGLFPILRIQRGGNNVSKVTLLIGTGSRCEFGVSVIVMGNHHYHRMETTKWEDLKCTQSFINIYGMCIPKKQVGNANLLHWRKKGACASSCLAFCTMYSA